VRRCIEASGSVPLDYMLAVMRDEDAEPWRRDEMAKAAAPYAASIVSVASPMPG